MGAGVYLHGFAVWAAMMAVETLHGTARTLLLAPRVGDLRARQIAVFTGSVLILAIACVTARWVGARSRSQLVLLGLGWVGFTLAFELALGRWAFGLSWERLGAEFALWRGGLMPIGLLVQGLAPAVAARWRGIWPPSGEGASRRGEGEEELIDRFLPRADVAERHETQVRAPADLVFEVARRMDLLSLPPVRAIFRLREKLLGSTPPPADRTRDFVSETLAMGWGRLGERPGRELVMGAVTRPWEADVTFRAIEPDRFAEFAEPDLVKTAWTLEAEPTGAARTRLRTQTRALATDDEARRKLRCSWRLVAAGVVLVRWLALGAIRRESERRFRARELVRRC